MPCPGSYAMPSGLYCLSHAILRNAIRQYCFEAIRHHPMSRAPDQERHQHYIAVAFVVVAYIVLAHIVLVHIVYGQYSYGPYSYGLYSYGPYSYGPYSYGLQELQIKGDVNFSPCSSNLTPSSDTTLEEVYRP